MDVGVRSGIITDIFCSTIIKAVNINRPDGVDMSIQKIVGDFYDQLHLVELSVGGQIFRYIKPSNCLGSFSDVLFIIDDQKIPVYKLTSLALKEAERLGSEIVNLSPMRINAPRFSKADNNESLTFLVNGIIGFDYSYPYPQNIKQVNIVVDNDHDLYETLTNYLYVPYLCAKK